MLRHLVDTLKIITQANFSRDDAIKPLVTYLAANLHDGTLNPFLNDPCAQFTHE